MQEVAPDPRRSLLLLPRPPGYSNSGWNVTISNQMRGSWKRRRMASNIVNVRVWLTDLGVRLSDTDSPRYTHSNGFRILLLL